MQASSVKEYMDRSRCISNVSFRISMRTYMKQQSRAKILNILHTGRPDFVNTMFVMSENDIKDNTENQCQCFGIVIPDDLLQQYIRKLFDCLTKADSVKKNIDANRCFMNVTFKKAMRTYIQQLTRARVGNLIQTGTKNFLNTMFVMIEDDIKDSTENRHECLGIIIPDTMIQQYIGRLFDCVTKTNLVEEYFKENSLLMNVSGREAIQNYMKQTTEETIGTLIQTGNRDFLNKLFVTTVEDIKYQAMHRYEDFGIVIPNDLIQQYLERWFDGLTNSNTVREYMDRNRCVRDVSFRKSLQIYIKQQTRRKIRNIYQTASRDFVNTMFVVTEDDIKDNAENRCECFGIVLPDSLLQQYIKRLFDGLTKADSVKKIIDANRCFKNDTYQIALQTYIKQKTKGKIENLIQTGSRDVINTMFVIREDEIKENSDIRYECFGIIIPDDLLQQFIERWFDGLTKTVCVRKCIEANRCFKNDTFQIALQTYIKQLTRGKIGNFIRTGSIDFINTMFVMTEDDIKDDDETRKECFGIVIPEDLLYKYIERWFGGMVKTDSVKQYIDENRTFMNSKFQANLDSYIRGINSERIEFFNREGHIDDLNTRRDLIKETSEIKS